MRIFLVRLAGFIIPGLIVFCFLFLLHLQPGILGVFEPADDFPGLILVFLPVALLVLNCFLLLYFNSSRLFFMNFFLLLSYFYINSPAFLYYWFFPEYLQQLHADSLALLVFLLPVPFGIFHFTSEKGIFNFNGLLKILMSVFILLLAPALVFITGSEVLGLIYRLPVWELFGSRISIVLLLELFALLLIFIIFRSHSFYTHNQIFTFWIVTAVVLVMTRVDLYISSDAYEIALDQALMYNIAAGLFTLRTINYAWSKAYRDQLTQIRGRMSLDEKLKKLRGNYSIAMIDIDNFKSFNDTYGHDSGDVVLKVVAELIENHSSGYAYRFGGEEFTIVYPHCWKEEAEDELEQLRKSVENTKVGVTRKSKRATKVLQKKVTVSIGLADNSEKYHTALEVLNAADNALFKAKDEGRNRLCVK